MNLGDVIHELQRGSCIVFVDGRSGAGKTALAKQLSKPTGANLLHLDDLYPGWGGLEHGSAAVAQALNGGAYRPYNWETQQFDRGSMVTPGPPLIIEGCGSITELNLTEARKLADTVIAIWLECPESIRRQRAVARDGDAYVPHWNRWAEQEARHLEQHRPRELADFALTCEQSAQTSSLLD